MATISTSERIMRLETNVTNLDKKVEAGFQDIKDNLHNLDIMVRQLVPTLVTQTQLTEKVTELDKKILELELDKKNADRRNALQVWITSSLSAILAVILTVLIQSYFSS
jgi:hypothetical protein